MYVYYVYPNLTAKVTARKHQKSPGIICQGWAVVSSLAISHLFEAHLPLEPHQDGIDTPQLMRCRRFMVLSRNSTFGYVRTAW